MLFDGLIITRKTQNVNTKTEKNIIKLKYTEYLAAEYSVCVEEGDRSMIR